MSDTHKRSAKPATEAGARLEAIVVELAERLHDVRAERDAALRAVEEIEAVIRKFDPSHPCLARKPFGTEGRGG
jgi:hypothetical protein